MTVLIRQPSRKRAEVSPDYVGMLSRYDYLSADGRWHVEQSTGCGRGWTVTDLTGQYVCQTCARNPDRHATIVPTLKAARAFIVEWSA